MGMLLTVPMIFAGVALMVFAYRRGTPSGNFRAVKA
jgi:prolipoprotein diacylglyceryltransferase